MRKSDDGDRQSLVRALAHVCVFEAVVIAFCVPFIDGDTHRDNVCRWFAVSASALFLALSSRLRRLSNTVRSNRLSDIEQQFAAALAAHGLQPPEIIPDGKLRRFDGPEDRKGKKNAWYVLHADEPAAGAFGCWKSNLSETWCVRAERELSPAEREARRQHIARAIEQAKAERERAAEDARLKCVELWSKGAPVAADHSLCHAQAHQARWRQATA